MKLTVTSAQNYDKKKDGTPMLDNKGRQKYRSVIKTVERGEEMLSGFVFKPINAGDVIDAELKPDTYNGVTRMSFSIVPSTQEKVQSAQTGEVMAEMRAQTLILRRMLEVLESVSMSLSTHQTIEAMKKPSVPVVLPDPNVELTSLADMDFEQVEQEVADEEDFPNPFG